MITVRGSRSISEIPVGDLVELHDGRHALKIDTDKYILTASVVDDGEVVSSSELSSSSGISVLFGLNISNIVKVDNVPSEVGATFIVTGFHQDGRSFLNHCIRVSPNSYLIKDSLHDRFYPCDNLTNGIGVEYATCDFEFKL